MSRVMSRVRFVDHVVVTRAVAEAGLVEFSIHDVDRHCQGSGLECHEALKYPYLAVCPECGRFQETNLHADASRLSAEEARVVSIVEDIFESVAKSVTKIPKMSRYMLRQYADNIGVKTRWWQLTSTIRRNVALALHGDYRI